MRETANRIALHLFPAIFQKRLWQGSFYPRGKVGLNGIRCFSLELKCPFYFEERI
jgi:hypothetical protein